ncbi:MAG: hypothetical protein FJ301_09925 [Planctomycetes bacterium]|nr:hypothetical protein [Planctomycetota bacterium]
MTSDPTTPREPEIEAMARGARRFLWVLRRALALAGCYGLGYGLWRCFLTEGAPSSKGFLWLAAGVLLVLRVEWTFGRGRWTALALCAALWWLPLVAFVDEEPHAWIVRVFASLAAFLSLFVWRTLWSLTKPLGE